MTPNYNTIAVKLRICLGRIYVFFLYFDLTMFRFLKVLIAKTGSLLVSIVMVRLFLVRSFLHNHFLNHQVQA